MSFHLEEILQFYSHMDKISYSKKQKGPHSSENLNGLL